jgi:hypothetical protein
MMLADTVRMELTPRKREFTYVVIEDAFRTRWGFAGFDSDPEAVFIGTEKNCADWIVRNATDEDSYTVILLDDYERLYKDAPEYEEERSI